MTFRPFAGRTWWEVGRIVSPFFWLRHAYRLADAVLFRLWWAAFTVAVRLAMANDALDASADRVARAVTGSAARDDG